MRQFRVILTSRDASVGTVVLDNEYFEGAEKFEITLSRHNKYAGIFPEISTKLKFYSIGRDYIWAAYQLRSIDAQVDCILQFRNSATEVYSNLYEGILDFRDVKFTPDLADCNMRPAGAIDLFLQRADTQLNLYDEPCFTELTFDKTARRIRYAHAPYLVSFPEKKINAYSNYILLEDSGLATATVYNHFKVESFGASVNAKVTICNNEPLGVCDSDEFSCQDHYDGDITNPRTPSLNEAYYPDGLFYISNAVPTFSLQDDLGMYNNAYVPQSDALQYSRNTGGVGDLADDIQPDEDPWDFGRKYEEQSQFIAEATCTCCISSCNGYTIHLQVKLSVDWCTKVEKGIIDFFCVRPEFVFSWGSYEQVWNIAALSCPRNTPGNPCNSNFGIECTSCLVPTCSGNLATDWTLDVTFTIPGCTVVRGDRMRIFQRNFFTYRGGESTAELALHTLSFITTYSQFNFEIQSEDCIPDAPKTPTSLVRSFMVHEALSRAVEHYTNNELKVRSCYFGRENSFTGADDANFQCPDSCSDYVNESSTTYQTYTVDTCCDSEFAPTPNSFTAEVTRTWSLINPVPAGGTDSVSGSLDVGSFLGNECNAIIDDGCIKITEPGTYEIGFSIAANVTGSGVSWQNITAGTTGGVGVVFDVVIKGTTFSVINEALDISVIIGICGTSSVQLPNIVTPPANQTVSFSTADIANGNNEICLNYALSATLGTLVGCLLGTRSITATATLNIVSVSISIHKINCSATVGYYSKSNYSVLQTNYSPYLISCLPCPTFDPSKFRETGGCGAWTIFTSGVNLRNFGTAIFTSFNDMFDALNAVYCIGVGTKLDEPDSVRVENREYFYQDTIILEVNADEHAIGLTRYPSDELIYNRFKGGFKQSKKDVIGTIDEYCTNREYTISVRNTRNVLDRTCAFIASGYSIEWQRRQKFTTNADYDAENFIVCVGRSTDINNILTVDYPAPVGTVNYPYHMYIIEQGIKNVFGTPKWWAPLGIVGPETAVNWRIAPYYNAVRNAIMWFPSMVKKAVKALFFSKGETNYELGGTEVGAPSGGCAIDYDYNTMAEITHYEKDDIEVANLSFDRVQAKFYPELVEIEIPLPPADLKRIRANPYGTIVVNGEQFYLHELSYKLSEDSKLILIKKA